MICCPIVNVPCLQCGTEPVTLQDTLERSLPVFSLSISLNPSIAQECRPVFDRIVRSRSMCENTAETAWYRIRKRQRVRWPTMPYTVTKPTRKRRKSRSNQIIKEVRSISPRSGTQDARCGDGGYPACSWPTSSMKLENVWRSASEAVAKEATCRRGRPRKRVLRLEGVSECKCIVFVSNP